MDTQRHCPRCGSEYDGATLFCPRDGSTLLLTTTDESLVGRVLADRYLVRRLLGSGGMGEVYLAEQTRMARECAVKVIRPSEATNPETVARFHREVSNASRLSHPNVVQVYDFGESEGQLFCVMEYVDGVSLAALLRNEGSLALPRALDLASQIAEALVAAHALGIVHRDLKPENVMVARTPDGRDQVKVVDFGVARVMDDASQDLTISGIAVGTLSYMSPEQLSGGPVDGRADIYALGIVLLEMLAGSSPPGIAREPSSRLDRLESLARSAAMRGEPWPRPVNDLLIRALASDVTQRWPSADEFLKALLAAADSVQRRSRGQSGRKRILFVATTGALSLAAIWMAPRVITDRSEQPDVISALRRARDLTDSSATTDDAVAALSLLSALNPRTKLGRVEAKFRALEANVRLGRKPEICRLTSELVVEGAQTPFARGIAVYESVARRECP